MGQHMNTLALHFWLPYALPCNSPFLFACMKAKNLKINGWFNVATSGGQFHIIWHAKPPQEVDTCRH